MNYDDDDLFDIIRALDDNPADTEPPLYTDELWAELHHTLSREERKADARVADTIVLQPKIPRAAPPRSLPRRIAVAAAAVAATIAVIVSIDADRRESISTDETPVPTVTVEPTVVPIPPAEACQRYVATEPTLADIQESLGRGLANEADFESAVAALATLQAELSTSDHYSAAELGSIDIAIATVRQASIEARLGQLEDASLSLTSAFTAFGDISLPPREGEGTIERPCLEAP